MPSNPVDWNLVVLGAWNVAILTPNWIAGNLFQLPPGTPVEIQVPMDGLGPTRVVHDGTFVSPSPSQLISGPLEPSARGLTRSAALVTRAINELSRTPMRAAGVNIRFRFDTVPESITTLLQSELDERLADKRLTTSSRGLQRAVRWEGGLLNLELSLEEDQSATVVFNFHRQSSQPAELNAWLGSTDAMVQVVGEIQRDVLHVLAEGAAA